MRRLLVLTILLFLNPFLLQGKQPNIVLILADDMGWTGLGSYGSTFYETPNIDKLAAEGLSLTSAYSAASNCAPSRASLMTGQYTPRHGVLYVGPGTYQDEWKERVGDLKAFPALQPKGNTTLSDSTKTIAEVLQSAGYRTAMFGKWHLGKGDKHPSKRGFNVAIESSGAHFNFETDPKFNHEPDEYLSDYLSDRAVDFIRGSMGDDTPFFLYYADFLVHKPFEAKESFLDYFSKKEPSQTQKSPMAGAMTKALDDSVGKLIQCLEETGKAENTLIIFTSDNGGLSYEEDGLGEKNTSNLPLRGRKGSEYEGGIRVPWIVKWPGKIPAGSSTNTPVHHIDIYPTLLAVAEANPPDHILDGIDLNALFFNPTQRLQTRNLFWFLPGYSSFHKPSVIIRIGEWKLIQRLDSSEHELYNTRFDIAETRNRKDDFNPMATDMQKLANRWLRDTGAPEMTPNPEYVPAASR
ncbi:MAG: sulfatase [Verrucomicrobia bacterium]|nr:sulfatase [Verrucomicrobiota bacterium]